MKLFKMFVIRRCTLGSYVYFLKYPALRNLCSKPLSFHAVSFGEDVNSSNLRQMAQNALDIQTHAPQDPLTPAAATVLSAYHQALDTVRILNSFPCYAL
jgi:hypothetical protein